MLIPLGDCLWLLARSGLAMKGSSGLLGGLDLILGRSFELLDRSWVLWAGSARYLGGS